MGVVGFLVTIIGVLLFVALIYQLEALHDAGKLVYQQIDANGFAGLSFGKFVIILWALVVVSCLIVLIQLFKSLFDKSIKKLFDAGAEELVNKFEKWTEK
ncbi:MAG: hypothetical protein ACYC1F_11270 [Gallionellaceae bacterium]